MAGYNALTNYNDWLNKQYSDLSQNDTYKSQTNNDMWNDLQNLHSKYDVGHAGYAQQQGSQINPSTFNQLNQQQQFKTFNDYGYNANDVKSWVDTQKTAYKSDLDSLIKKYTSTSTGDSSQVTPPDQTTTSQTSASTGTSQNSTSNNQQVMDSTYDWILANKDNPAFATLSGLKDDLAKMNENNQAMLDKEKARTDEIINLLQNNAKVDTTQNFTDILNGVISQDNPIYKKAAALVNQDLAKRGLYNSTYGSEIAQDAILKKAQEIAMAEMQGQQFNSGQRNSMQGNLLGELGATGRQSLNFMGDIYRQDQNFNQNLLGDRQTFAFDVISNQQKMNEDIRKLREAHEMEMDKTMLEYTEARATEYIKQQSGLYSSFLEAWQQISTSEIPQSSKDLYLRGLGNEISRAGASLKKLSEIDIVTDGDGYKIKNNFDPWGGKTNTAASQNTTNNTSNYNYSKAANDGVQLTSQVNRIYSQVRASGGDTPEEALIDKWRKPFDWAKDNDKDLFTKAMKIYNQYGISDWEKVLDQQVKLLMPAFMEFQQNRINIMAPGLAQ